MKTLERARGYLAKLPVAVSGQGGHRATFRAACVLVHGFALGADEALAVLREWNRGCQPPWSESELRHKVGSAMSSVGGRAAGYLLGGETGSSRGVEGRSMRTCAAVNAPREKPRFREETLKRIAALLHGVDEQFVKVRSPLSPEGRTPAWFLMQLYRAGESVLVFDDFKSQGRHVCQMDDQQGGVECLDHLVNGCPDGVWFLCNPVDGEFHPNPRLGNKRSRRSEESVTAWRYLVLESDVAEPADWLAALVQMPLRIAAIYTSGGHSIHALVRLDAVSKRDWDARAHRLKPLMTVLGADPAAITAVRLTRLPGCHRGQDGPTAPKFPPVSQRWVEGPLQFDERGDPIWLPVPLPTPVSPWTGGNLQELLYLDPNPDGQPICCKPTRTEIHARWLARVRNEPMEIAS